MSDQQELARALGAEITGRLEDLVEASILHHTTVRPALNISAALDDIRHLVDAYNALSAPPKKKSQKR